MSHAPYHSAKILFYFCATNFFRSAFSSLATRKNDASSPPSAATAKGRNSILWTSFKNKPTFRKNTTTFLTFSTGLKQEIITRRNNIRPEVKFLAHSTSSHAHHARTTFFRFLPSLLHLLFQHTNTQNITGEGFTLFCLHLPSPVLPLYPTPSVKAFRGEAFTLIALQFKPLRHKGEEVKAKIGKTWCARNARAKQKIRHRTEGKTHLRLDNHPRQKNDGREQGFSQPHRPQKHPHFIPFRSELSPTL